MNSSVKLGQEVGVLEHVQQVEGAPAGASTSSLSAAGCAGSGSASSFGTVIHGSPLPGGDPHPAAPLPVARAPGPAGRGASAIRCRRPAMNSVGSSGLTHRGVVDVAVVLEVAGQVVLRVAPPAGAIDLDLPATQRVAQRDQHAQLVRDPLDPALLVDHRVAPRLRHHPVDRDRRRAAGRRSAVLPSTLGVAAPADPTRPSPAGRRCCCSGTQRRQQRGQHPPVVVGVRATQHRAHPPGTPARSPWPRGPGPAASSHPRPGTDAVRTVSSGCSTAASASRNRRPSLPRTRRRSSISSPSTLVPRGC